jgi:two-component system, NtrC family, response regulator AtoC
MNAVKKSRILVLEDDKLFRWTLHHFLMNEGYDVCGAATAEVALDLAQQQAFDVVISDFHLPGSNGIELIKKIKSLNPVTKTVLISAYQKEETGSDDESVLNAYLNKPIELENLKQILLDLLTGAAPEMVPIRPKCPRSV